MKKFALVFAIITTLAFSANAQKKDSYFNWNDATDEWNRETLNNVTFTFPAVHGGLFDADAPLGSGLLILGALGVGYAIKKKVEVRS